MTNKPLHFWMSIYCDDSGLLRTNLFRINTAGNTILQPRSLVNSIPYSQYLCTRRTCSEDAKFDQEAKKLKDRLLDRGYRKSCLKKAYDRAEHQSHQELIFSSSLRTQTDDHVRFITRYTEVQANIRRILKYWYILRADPSINRFVPERHLITFRRAKSLQDRLVTSHYSEPKQGDPCKSYGYLQLW